MGEERIPLVLVKEAGERQLSQHHLKLAKRHQVESSQGVFLRVSAGVCEDGRLVAVSGWQAVHSPDSSLSVHSFVSWFLLLVFILSRPRCGAWESKPRSHLAWV